MNVTDNQRKHGVSFEEAVTVFDDPSLSCRTQAGMRSIEMRRMASALLVNC